MASLLDHGLKDGAEGARPRYPGLALVVVAPTVLHRDGLCRALAAHHGLRVVACTSTALGAIDAVGRESVDTVAVVVDLSDELNGLRTAGDIADRAPGVCLVGLSHSTSDDLAVAAAEAGLSALVGPDDKVIDLVTAIDAARRGELRCSPRAAAVLQRRLRTLMRERGSATANRVTERELEVMRLIDGGLSNREVARRLSIELSTVKNHLHNVFEKLDVHDRRHAVELLRADGCLPVVRTDRAQPRSDSQKKERD